MFTISTGTKLLCLAPHPDDAEFGMGATLNRFRDRAEARIVTFTDRQKSRGEQLNDVHQREAAARLGVPAERVHFIDELGYGVSRLPIRLFAAEETRDVVQIVVAKLIRDFRPDVIFVPGIRETHQDHVAIAEETVRIARGDFSILGYEVPKHNRHFQPDAFIKVSEDDMAAKCAAIGTYTEFTNRYYFEDEGIKALARTRALHAGHQGLVEAFETYQLCLA